MHCESGHLRSVGVGVPQIPYLDRIERISYCSPFPLLHPLVRNSRQDPSAQMGSAMDGVKQFLLRQEKGVQRQTLGTFHFGGCLHMKGWGQKGCYVPAFDLRLTLRLVVGQALGNPRPTIPPLRLVSPDRLPSSSVFAETSPLLASIVCM